MSVTLSKSGDSVVLPNPGLGDKDVTDPQKTVKHSRSGEPMIALPTNRAKYRVFTFEFLRLTSTEKDALETFLTDHTGESITMNDHHGDDRTVVISRSVIDMVTYNDNCSYDALVDFLEDVT